MSEGINRRTKNVESSESFTEGALEGFPIQQKQRAKKAEKQHPEPAIKPVQPEAEQPVQEFADEEEFELLPGEEEYAQLQTIHLKSPQPFPRATEEVRASMFSKLNKLNNEVRPEDKRLFLKIDFYSKAKRLFKQKGDLFHDDTLVTYADQLYRTYLRGHSLAETMYNILLLLNIHNTIAVSIGEVLRVRIQMLASALVDSALIHHDITPAQFSKIDNILAEVKGDVGEGFKKIVENRIWDYVKVRSYAEQLHGRMAAHHESLQTMRPELQEMGNEFMKSIRNLRRYGIKSSYYQDGFLHDDGDAWVVTDINDIVSVKSRRGIVAMISLAHKDDLIKADGLRYDRKTDAVSLRYESSYPAGASFFLKWDGELHDTAPDRHLSAQEIFQRVGAEDEYELVRVSCLARIHDLVVPVELTRSLPSLDDLGQVFRRRFGEKGEQENTSVVIQKIFLPRISLNTDARVQQMLDDEYRQRIGNVREHDVTAFTRELPHGNHPSPDAIALAREYNFIIDPQGDRTFVRPHKRGRGGEGFIHELQEK